jgi:hypothetical protein
VAREAQAQSFSGDFSSRCAARISPARYGERECKKIIKSFSRKAMITLSVWCNYITTTQLFINLIFHGAFMHKFIKQLRVYVLPGARR